MITSHFYQMPQKIVEMTIIKIVDLDISQTHGLVNSL
jgi:hypothetical protein